RHGRGCEGATAAWWRPPLPSRCRSERHEARGAGVGMIVRGRDWGSPGPLPEGGGRARSDAQARAVGAQARGANHPVPPIGLLGGALCRALGGAGDEARLRSDTATRLAVDLGAVLVD